FYNIGIKYYALVGSGAKIAREILIDGEIPYSEAERIEFSRFWKDTTAPLQDSFGDDVKPFSEEAPRFEDTLLFDSDGKYGEALRFLLTAGEHEITFKYISQPMFIESVYLSAPETLPSYKEYFDSYNTEVKWALGETIEFEAEAYDRVIEKSDSVIGVENSGDPSASPKSVKNVKMNYIGGAGYRTGNQSISWRFSAPKSGFYMLGLRVAQWYNDGLPVYRQIKIDGEVPFAEFDCYSFAYNDNWYSTIVSNGENEPYYVWLDEGEHTLTLTVKLGEYRKVEETLFTATNKLSAIIRRIKMITGEDPDNNYDYEIVKNVPGIIEEIESLNDELVLCENLTLALAGKKSSMSNSFNSISEQLLELIDNPDRIPKRLSDLETALGNLGDWIGSIKSMPLGIDKFWIASPTEIIENYKSNSFEKLYSAIVKFSNSFIKDYQSVSTVDNGVTADTELEVWVGRGTEWCRLIKQLSDAEFTPNSNAVININVLPSSQIATAGVNTVLLSVAAGTAPDVVLGLGSSMPVEYAVRNAIVDLSKLEGFEDTKSKIYGEAFKPLTWGGGVYGLPETVNFRCIYYRTDIFDELKLTVPNTWDEFYADTLPVLYQNGLKCYIPMLYDIFLYQNGGQ
ncbi:MAG: extracellular solute-binding protein, partial [Clostridia bacterium]|nr:extracellular solute-binding protein [Clostridia bacterium]